MASLNHDPNGTVRIQFVATDGSRKTIRLGKCSKRDSQTIKFRVEALLSSTITGSLDRDTSLWLASITESNRLLRAKLEAVGLVEPLVPEPGKPTLTLASFLVDFMKRNGASKKPATRVVWQQVINSLNKHLPKGILLQEVTAGHAKGFLQKLQAQRTKRQDGTIRKLSSTTIHKRISFARQFFQDACDWEQIDKNPFGKIKTQGTSLKSNVEVPMETIQTVLKRCNSTWKAIVALSRIGGLRCPSETLSITWGDVDFENSRLSIPEPKVEHHEGRGVRSCPLFPELRTILEELFEESTIDGKYPSPESFVVDKPAYRAAAMQPGGWANANLRTQFLKILRRAGVSPWSRLFHSMRASRQTELEREFPLHVVCSWLGNTEAVAKRNYLLVTDADFRKATEMTPPKSDAFSDAVDPKSDAFSDAASSRTEPHLIEKTSENIGEIEDSLDFSEVSGWRRGELNPRPAILPIRPLHV